MSERNSNNSNKKTVVITGAASGMGLHFCCLYHADGHTVVGISAEPASIAAAALPENIPYFQADVCDGAAMSAVFADIEQQFGAVDIVIANAGINHNKAAVPDFERGRKVFEVNVLGVMNTIGPAIEQMQRQGSGQLVFMASIAGTSGTPGTAFYGASKAAIINMAEAFAIDLADSGINVTTIVPGFISTPLTAENRHKMPFILDSEVAARKIKAAIDKNKGFHVLPTPLRIISAVLSRLPRRWYCWFMRRDPLNMRQ